MNDVPIGHSVLSKDCAKSALNKIKDSTCVTLKTYLKGEVGTFVVCKGKLVSGKWRDLQGEEAWNSLLSEIEKVEPDAHLSVNFYPPPEDIDITDEMSADALASEEVGTEYVASIGVLALGKAVLGIVHRLNASGIEFDDIKVTVRDGVATIVLINPHPKPSEELVKSIASMYLYDVGIKDVKVEIV